MAGPIRNFEILDLRFQDRQIEAVRGGLEWNGFPFGKDFMPSAGSMPFRYGCRPAHRFDDLAPADARVVSAKGDLAFLGAVRNHAHLGAPEVVCPQILKPHALDAEDAPVVAFAAGLHSIVPVAIGTLRCRPEEIHDL